jgi:O-antigen/teichoic acid export membrane protein
MFGLAAVADPMIRFLLTDKWAFSIPFVMIYSLICLTWPLSAKLHALNAIGKSGVSLAQNIVMKTISIVLMILAIQFGIFAVVYTGVFVAYVNVIVISLLTAKYFDYTFKEQISDVLPIYFVGFIMFVPVYLASTIITFNPFVEILILVSLGIVIYSIVSFIFKLKGFMYLYNNAIRVIKKILTKSISN